MSLTLSVYHFIYIELCIIYTFSVLHSISVTTLFNLNSIWLLLSPSVCLLLHLSVIVLPWTDILLHLFCLALTTTSSACLSFYLSLILSVSPHVIVSLSPFSLPTWPCVVEYWLLTYGCNFYPVKLCLNWTTFLGKNYSLFRFRFLRFSFFIRLQNHRPMNTIENHQYLMAFFRCSFQSPYVIFCPKLPEKIPSLHPWKLVRGAFSKVL